MILFLFALVVAALGVGAYAHYNTGVQDITLRTYHFTGVPVWEPVAAAAAVPLFLFLLHAIFASVRYRMLRRTSERRAGEPASRQPAPKRSWTPSGE